MIVDLKDFRKNFLALDRIYRGKPVIYFDNACMTLKPKPVVDAMNEYYNNYPGCHGRTSHLFGAETTLTYNRSREKIRQFFNAALAEEIVFVRNTTEALNILANCLDFQENDLVVSSDIEHNSNLIPWQIMQKKKNIRRYIVKTNPDTTFNPENFKEALSDKVKLVSILVTSNLSGVSFPIEEIIDLAHKNGALVCLDAAQASLYKLLDVRKLNVDFMVTSLHKMWGPTGVGVLYGKKKYLENMPQFLTGGETVYNSWYDHYEEALLPDRFEAGLQNYAGVIGSGAAIDCIHQLGQKRIYQEVVNLNQYASEQLLKINEVKLIGPNSPELRSGILNFFISGLPVSDVARLLNEAENIMTRFGKHCVHAWFNENQLGDSLRVSFAAYNTQTEVDIFIAALKNIIKYFK